jgi:hypothetical protein
VEFYYAMLSPEAARGPITAEEEAARRERAAIAKAEREAAQAVSLLSGVSQMDGLLDGGFQLDSYDPDLPFYLLTPEVVDSTNVLVTIANADTNSAYDILHTPGLEIPNWNIVSTGAVGQIQFTVPMIGITGFYRGVQGQDWDGDGIPNWMDASPLEGSIGALTITIESPLHNSTIY